MTMALEAPPEVGNRKILSINESRFDQLCRDEDFDKAREFIDTKSNETVTLSAQRSRALLGFRELASYLDGVERPEQVRNIIANELDAETELSYEVFSAYGELAEQLERIYEQNSDAYADILNEGQATGHIAETIVLALAARTAAHQLDRIHDGSIAYIASAEQNGKELDLSTTANSLSGSLAAMQNRNDMNVLYLPIAATREDDQNGVDSTFYVSGADQLVPVQVKANINPSDMAKYPPETLLVDIEQLIGASPSDMLINGHSLASAIINEVNGRAEEHEVRLINRAAHTLQFRLAQKREVHNYSTHWTSESALY